jgi:Htaa
MIAHPTLSRRAAGAALIAFAVLALATTLLTGTASATPGSGEVVLSFKSDAKGSLSKQGVKVTSSAKAAKTGSAKRAGAQAQVVSLAVSQLNLGAAAKLQTKGGLTLSAKGRTASLSNVALQVGAKSTAIAAKLEGQQLVFFRAKGKSQTDASSVKLNGAALSLTSAGAKALREALGLDSLAADKVGTAAVDAALLVTVARPSEPTPAPQPQPPHGTGALPPDEGPAPVPYPFAAQCPVATVAGNPGFGDVPGEVSGILPSPTFNPGTAQSVTGSSIEWGFKDSFRSYVGNVPPAGSMLGLDGAVATPNGPSMALPGSFFDFPVDGGTYESGTAADHSDDKLVVNGSGTALFCKAGHGFSVALKNPTLVIDGANSRIVADVGVNQNGTWFGFQRADFAELDLSGVEPVLSDGGNTLVWEDIPAILSADGDLASGLYPAGETLEPISVRTTLQRPLLTQCSIDAGVGTPPAVDFTKAALPTLSNPVSGTSGTINWGFRRATRNTVTLPTPGGGSFQLLGGATESYPGNMGGGNSAAPTGGLGKFFRFPIASYEYEEGEAANPNDDRLIATSNATVGFCIPNAGSFGLVISKPTLVIDGTNSRLVANAYSYAAPSKGWIGGRVDLVDLDTSAVGAVSTSGTVSWGEVNANETPLTSGIPVDGGLKTEALSLTGLTVAGTASGGFDPVAAQIALPTP